MKNLRIILFMSLIFCVPCQAMNVREVTNQVKKAITDPKASLEQLKNLVQQINQSFPRLSLFLPDLQKAIDRRSLEEKIEKLEKEIQADQKILQEKKGEKAQKETQKRGLPVGSQKPSVTPAPDKSAAEKAAAEKKALEKKAADEARRAAEEKARRDAQQKAAEDERRKSAQSAAEQLAAQKAEEAQKAVEKAEVAEKEADKVKGAGEKVNLHKDEIDKNLALMRDAFPKIEALRKEVVQFGLAKGVKKIVAAVGAGKPVDAAAVKNTMQELVNQSQAAQKNIVAAVDKAKTIIDEVGAAAELADKQLKDAGDIQNVDVANKIRAAVQSIENELGTSQQRFQRKVDLEKDAKDAKELLESIREQFTLANAQPPKEVEKEAKPYILTQAKQYVADAKEKENAIKELRTQAKAAFEQARAAYKAAEKAHDETLVKGWWSSSLSGDVDLLKAKRKEVKEQLKTAVSARKLIADEEQRDANEEQRGASKTIQGQVIKYIQEIEAFENRMNALKVGEPESVQADIEEQKDAWDAVLKRARKVLEQKGQEDTINAYLREIDNYVGYIGNFLQKIKAGIQAVAPGEELEKKPGKFTEVTLPKEKKPKEKPTPTPGSGLGSLMGGLSPVDLTAKEQEAAAASADAAAKAAADVQAAEQAKKAAEKAAEDKKAAEVAAQEEKAKKDKEEAERIAREKAAEEARKEEQRKEAERVAKQKAEAERLEKERLAQIEKEKQEQLRKEAEQAAEKARLEKEARETKEAAEKAAADKKAAEEKAQKTKFANELGAWAGKNRARREKGALAREAQRKKDIEDAEKRATKKKEEAIAAKKEAERLEKEAAEKVAAAARAEQEKIAAEKVAQEKAEAERLAKEEAERKERERKAEEVRLAAERKKEEERLKQEREAREAKEAREKRIAESIAYAKDEVGNMQRTVQQEVVQAQRYQDQFQEIEKQLLATALYQPRINFEEDVKPLITEVSNAALGIESLMRDIPGKGGAVLEEIVCAVGSREQGSCQTSYGVKAAQFLDAARRVNTKLKEVVDTQAKILQQKQQELEAADQARLAKEEAERAAKEAAEKAERERVEKERLEAEAAAKEKAVQQRPAGGAFTGGFGGGRKVAGGLRGRVSPVTGISEQEKEVAKLPAAERSAEEVAQKEKIEKLVEEAVFKPFANKLYPKLRYLPAGAQATITEKDAPLTLAKLAGMSAALETTQKIMTYVKDIMATVEPVREYIPIHEGLKNFVRELKGVVDSIPVKPTTPADSVKQLSDAKQQLKAWLQEGAAPAQEALD